MYEYEHMLGWANVQRHREEEITLLCDRHHGERTAGLLPIADVEKANASPRNLQTGASAAQTLHFSGSESEFVIGGNRFAAASRADFAAIVVDDTPLLAFRFEDGHYLAWVTLFDEDDQPVLVIEDNELTYSTEPWDIEFVGKELSVRSALRKFFLVMRFEPPDRIELSQGHVLLHGVELLVQPDFLLILNTLALFQGSTFTNHSAALNLGESARYLRSGIRVPHLPRDIDRAARLKEAREWLAPMGLTLGSY